MGLAMPDLMYGGDVGWVKGQNGGPSPQRFPDTSHLNERSGWPAILSRNPPIPPDTHTALTLPMTVDFVSKIAL